MTDVYFAQRAYVGGAGEPVSATISDRLKHTLILGKSGTGKSSLIKILFLADVYAGRGCALLDPHGDLAESLLYHIPRDRVRDVVYFEPAERDNPANINLLDSPRDPDMRAVVADGIISILHAHWGDAWGPRMEQILRHTLLALLDFDEDTTLLGVGRLLTDESYRRRVVSRAQNPITRAYFEDQFERYSARFRIEAITPILNRLEKLTSNPLMRNLLGVPKSTINIRRIMDEGQILIANLAGIGKSYTDLLGSILLGIIELAALERSSIPENRRRPFFVYVDEMHGFSGNTIGSMIGQVRKFGVGLTLATQTLANYSDEMKTTLMTCGSVAAFRVSGRDAQWLDPEFDREVPPEAFTSLEPFQAYLKMPDGSIPFRAYIDKPPSYYRRRRKAQIIKASRAQYSRPRHVVEAKIDRWMRDRTA
ncbi:MAG: type IV secretion system DNA-binding domain-containing protein [Bacteroidetes bacterium]|nr:type IV secretion system DNA-binding domain-containing protein [Bacteroidota bacterium]